MCILMLVKYQPINQLKLNVMINSFSISEYQGFLKDDFSNFSFTRSSVFLNGDKVGSNGLSQLCNYLWTYIKISCDTALKSEPGFGYSVSPSSSWFGLGYVDLNCLFRVLLCDYFKVIDKVLPSTIKEAFLLVESSTPFITYLSPKQIDNYINIPTCTFYYFNGCFYRSMEELDKAVKDAYPTFNNHLNFV